MVTLGPKLWSIETSDVAFFISEEKATFLVTKDGQHLPMEYSLDQLAALLDPDRFFRVNRQFLVARPALGQIQAYSAGKVRVELRPAARQEVFVSMSRLAEFKDWLGR